MPDVDGALDDATLRNLDTQHRRLAEIEATLDALLAGDAPGAALPATPDRPESYELLTATNDALRDERGWDTVDLDAALTPEALAEFELWRRRRRTPWQVDDIAAVALAGALGIAATCYDTSIDQAVRRRLEALSKSPLIQGWERAGKRLPIDYTGEHIGGPDHRVRSAGHDIARPLEALRQLREGKFQGTYWRDGVRYPLTSVTTPHGTPYVPIENVGTALTVWAKHLVADFVTPMSLPIPGFSAVCELPIEQAHDFARAAYSNGTNLRSLATSTLPVMTTEVTVRTHVHGRALLARRTAVLESGERALRSELLLAGHSFVGAASLGRAVTTAMAAASPLGVLAQARAFRHINWPVLFKLATSSLDVAHDSRARHSTAASWDDLLANVAAPWQLDEAIRLDAAVSDIEP